MRARQVAEGLDVFLAHALDEVPKIGVPLLHVAATDALDGLRATDELAACRHDRNTLPGLFLAEHAGEDSPAGVGVALPERRDNIGGDDETFGRDVDGVLICAARYGAGDRSGMRFRGNVERAGNGIISHSRGPLRMCHSAASR